MHINYIDSEDPTKKYLGVHNNLYKTVGDITLDTIHLEQNICLQDILEACKIAKIDFYVEDKEKETFSLHDYSDESLISQITSLISEYLSSEITKGKEKLSKDIEDYEIVAADRNNDFNDEPEKETVPLVDPFQGLDSLRRPKRRFDIQDNNGYPHQRPEFLKPHGKGMCVLDNAAKTPGNLSSGLCDIEDPVDPEKLKETFRQEKERMKREKTLKKFEKEHGNKANDKTDQSDQSEQNCTLVLPEGKEDKNGQITEEN